MNIKRGILKILLIQILLLTFAGSVSAVSTFVLEPGNNQLWHQNVSGILNVAEANDQFGRSAAAGDFNGDGFEDLAIGVPSESIGGAVGAGAVQVIYGDSTGLTSVSSQIWHQNSPGIFDSAESGDSFGYSVAAGDLNGDGKDDLVVGIPFENIGSVVDAGAVQVIYGSSSGLTSAGSQIWHQNSAGIADVAEAGDKFGYSIAIGDFNGDGKDDLATGVPQEDIGSITNAGAVNIIYGTSSGLTSAGNKLSYQGKGSIGVAETGDQFGFSLTSGDFNGNGKDDLVVGVPYEDVGSVADTGVVNVIYGTSSGLSGVGSQQWYQSSSDILGVSGTGDRFGYSVTHGDFDDDGRDDLAVGVPYDDVGTRTDAGVVNVIYGTSSGLSAAGNQYWHQSKIAEAAETNDRFGFSLATKDFNGDGSDDLAVGVPYEDLGTKIDVGVVNIIYGSPAVGYGSTGGLVSDDSQQWYQGKSGVQQIPESGDKFGYAIATGDFDGNGFGDIAIGVPYEDLGSVIDAGVANILYGS